MFCRFFEETKVPGPIICGGGFGFKDHDVKCSVASCLFCNGKISQLRQKEHGHASDVLLPVSCGPDMRIRTPSACIANGVYCSSGVPSMETDARELLLVSLHLTSSCHLK